ncbi:hypothetical protein KP509_1Z203600 [Ceratopteris richardii]|nr:hypothetical protein KP509_1Z203600 [Ceratopteris richardii]
MTRTLRSRAHCILSSSMVVCTIRASSFYVISFAFFVLMFFFTTLTHPSLVASTFGCLDLDANAHGQGFGELHFNCFPCVFSKFTFIPADIGYRCFEGLDLFLHDIFLFNSLSLSLSISRSSLMSLI